MPSSLFPGIHGSPKLESTSGDTEGERTVRTSMLGSVPGVQHWLRGRRPKDTSGLGWRVRKWHDYFSTQIVFSCTDPICSRPNPLPWVVGNLEANSFFPAVMPQFPWVQLPVRFSKPILLFFLITRALVLFRLAMLPVEVLPFQIPLLELWWSGATVLATGTETYQILGHGSWRTPQNWADLVSFIFLAFWPFCCLLD